jgi:hypothetical protein
MANVYLQDSTLTAIGNAIRAKAGNTTQLLPSEMPAAITNLPSGGGKIVPYVGDKEVYNRFQFTSAQSILHLSDFGVGISTFKNLKCVSGGIAHSKAISKNIMTTADIAKNNPATWQIYPILGQYFEYPADVVTAIKALTDDTVQLFPCVITTDQANATASNNFPYLMGISGGAWMGMAVAAIYHYNNYLQMFSYNYVNKTASVALQTVVAAKGYVYWR